METRTEVATQAESVAAMRAIEKRALAAGWLPPAKKKWPALRQWAAGHDVPWPTRRGQQLHTTTCEAGHSRQAQKWARCPECEAAERAAVERRRAVDRDHSAAVKEAARRSLRNARLEEVIANEVKTAWLAQWRQVLEAVARVGFSENAENRQHLNHKAAKHRRRSRLRAEDTVTAKDLASLLRFQEDRCVYCREPLPGTRHLDHVTPLSRGGAHALSNLAWACGPCNMAKGAKTLAEFRATRTSPNLSHPGFHTTGRGTILPMSEFKRSGNLMACECGHMKAFHFAGGPLGEPTCAHCPQDDPCQGYKEGADQGLHFHLDPRAH